MHIQLGQRYIHKVTQPQHLNGMYNTAFWEVELVDAPDCSIELLQPGLWIDNTTPAISNQRKQCSRCNSEMLTEILRLPDQHRAEFIRAAGQVDTDTRDAYFKKMWPMGTDYYINNTRTATTINYDMPGFATSLHCDNNHIILQLIVNLTDNDTGTELFDITSPDSYYTMTGQRNKGIIFLNGAGSLHTVRNIKKDRYTLYSATMIGYPI
jgi:hypothetical protein